MHSGIEHLAYNMFLLLVIGYYIEKLIGRVQYACIYIFSGVFAGDMKGLIPVLVMLVSAIIMAASGILVKILKWQWVSDYALPISLIAGMASAIPITAWLS